jgi:hypothetical protein
VTATASSPAGESVEQTRETWRRRIRDAEEAQKAFHGRWATALAFAAGEQWLVWNKRIGQLRSIRDEDERYADKELYTADRILEIRQSALGELGQDDNRPQLLTVQDGPDAENVDDVANRLVRYAWDDEWQADDALDRGRELCVDLGVSAIRCCWDPDQGNVTGRLATGADGSPLGPEMNAALAEQGALPDGSLPRYRPVKEGRTSLEVYSAFQLLTPPGVTHEKMFPWEALRQVASVDDVRDLYGVRVNEDTNIANSIGLPAATAGQAGQQQRNRIRDHCWLYLCYDRPTRRNAQGRTLIFAGANLALCDVREGLDYSLDGQPHSGIVYLHWWRRSDRFQSQGLIDRLVDPQRIVNRRKTQNLELVDSGMPKLITRKGDWPDTTGATMEIVELDAKAADPHLMEGHGPGGWMYQDIASLDEDISHASTISPLRLGENPNNVQTYGQLALLNDNEQVKRERMIQGQRAAVATIVKLGLYDIERYWPDEKQATVEGEDGRLERAVFRKSDIPKDVRVKPADGSPLPRTQGAQIKKVDAIFQAAVESGAAARDPDSWTAWYKASYDAGEPQDLPTRSPSTQQQLAQLENMLMRQGEEVEPAYYDDLHLHLPVHRTEQDQARADGDVELAARVERHIQKSKTLTIQANAAAAPPVPPQAPGLPQGPPPGPSAAPPPDAPPQLPPGASSAPPGDFAPVAPQ